MNVAILHYHLKPGGVTTVIGNAVRALSGRFSVQVLADFNYDPAPARSRRAFLAEASALAGRLAARLRGVDVLHTHNITLGKNPRLTCAVKLIAQRRRRLKIINQIHDFPEDDRPAALRALRHCTGRRDDEFYRSLCYYDLPNVWWATLTTAAAGKLAARGVPAAKIHVLPNPVDDEFFTQPAPDLGPVRAQLAAYARRHGYRYDPRHRLLLSPMKVMARKNNAEAVELVRCLPGCQLLISLDASSARDRAYSEQLKRKIRRERLPVVIGFGAELENPLPLFHLAHAILTTSRQEGFGYAFLEGWLCRKLVLGRDLPAVTQDFKAAGMKLEHLYPNFGPGVVAQIRPLLARPPRDLIEHNRRVVSRHYSLAAYSNRYASLLDKLANGTRTLLR